MSLRAGPGCSTPQTASTCSPQAAPPRRTHIPVDHSHTQEPRRVRRWDCVQGSEQTRLGRFFDRHPALLRSLAISALLWGVGYLTWRVGWSGEGASPVAFAMLLVTEVYGLWALGTLAWFSWS